MRIYRAMATKQKIKFLITHDAHASPSASQKAQFIKSQQFSYFQPIVKQIVDIKFMKFTLIYLATQF